MKKIKILSLLFFVGCIVSCSSASVGSNNDIHQNIPNNDEHKVEDTVEQDDVIEDNITLKNIDSIKSKDNNVVNIFEWINDNNGVDTDNSAKDVDVAINSLKEKNIDGINKANNTHAKRVLMTYLENNGASGNDYKLSKPVSDDVLGHVNLHKYFSYMDHNKHKGKKIYDAKGIINLSFGEESFPNVIHFVKNREMYVEDFRTTLFNGSTAITNWSKLANNIKGDFKNDRLVLKSLGNGGSTYWCSSYSQYVYTTLSPELQKIARNDMILVSNIITPDTNWERLPENKVATINNEDYYIPEYNTSKAMLLRSLTMAAPGFKNRSFGSSYSAPFVARTAQMILKKYPYLTYNQVKQILFTTATSDKTYLNNVFGWGVLNQEKALKGPGALNGGLIEEEKYWKGNYDKVVDKRDKNLFYMYVDIPSDVTSIWSNDIEGGLKGDGYSKTYKTVNIPSNDSKTYRYRMPDVLDSERNYYDNVAKGGLRKAGKGTLYLTGKQLYNSNTQILDGKLVLQNDSNSKYEILNDGTLEISGRKVNVNNNIYNNANMDVKKDLNVKEYYGSKESKLLLEKNINTDKFVNKGKMQVVSKNGKTPTIKGKDVDLKDMELENVFAKIVESGKDLNNNKVYEVAEKKYREFKDLSESEKENLPYYDVVAKEFFKEYKFKYGTKANSSFINVTDKSESSALNKIFTDNYTSFINETINANDTILSNNILQYRINDNNTVYMNRLDKFNIFKDKRANAFNRHLSGYSVGVKKTLANDINVGVFGNIYNGKYTFTNGGKIENSTYGLGLNVSKDFNNVSVLGSASYNLTLGDMTRTLNNNQVKINNNFVVSNVNLSLQGEYKKKVLDNLVIKPNVELDYSYTKLHDVKESMSSDILNNLALEFKNNNIHRLTTKVGVDAEYKINNFSITNGVKYSYTHSTQDYLNAKLGDVDIKLRGYNENEHKFSYNLGAKYTIDNFSINGAIGINTTKRVTTSVGLSYKY